MAIILLRNGRDNFCPWLQGVRAGPDLLVEDRRCLGDGGRPNCPLDGVKDRQGFLRDVRHKKGPVLTWPVEREEHELHTAQGVLVFSSGPKAARQRSGSVKGGHGPQGGSSLGHMNPAWRNASLRGRGDQRDGMFATYSR